MESNWLSWIVASVLISFVFYAGMTWYENEGRVDNPLQLEKRRERMMSSTLEMRSKLMAAPRPLELTEAPLVSEECLKVYKEIESLDMAADDTAWPSTETCKPNAELKPAHEIYVENCQKFWNSESDEEISSACLTGFATYRAAIHNFFRKDEKTEDTDDMNLLFDRLWLAVGTVDGKPNPQVMEEVAQRMIDLNPDYYDPAKVLIGAKLMKMATSGKEVSENDPIWNELEEAQRKAEDFGVEDTELWESAILIETRGMKDFSRLENAADEVDELFPKSGLGPYYRASIAWRNGDREQTQELLEEAIALNPKNSRYRESLENLKTAKEGDAIMSASINFNFDLSSSFQTKKKKLDEKKDSTDEKEEMSPPEETDHP